MQAPNGICTTPNAEQGMLAALTKYRYEQLRCLVHYQVLFEEVWCRINWAHNLDDTLDMV